MTKIEKALKPFRVPNFVIEDGDSLPRQQGFVELPKHALKDLPAQVLSDLCDEFRVNVFAQAGKPDPKEPNDQT